MLPSGAHVRDDGSVVVLRVAVTVLDDVAAVVAAQCLGAGLAAGIGGPLDDEERALAGLDVLEQHEQQVFGRVVPGRPRLGYRAQDRRGRGHGSHRASGALAGWLPGPGPRNSAV